MKKILIVDDEKDVVDSLGQLLRRAGYGIFTAMTGGEALTIAKKELPQLIILDLILPDIDGTEVAASLIQFPKTRDIPIIFLTSVMTKSEEEISGTNIANRCIVAKPCRSEEILTHVKDHIGPPA